MTRETKIHKRLGTRGSKLALRQAAIVKQAIEEITSLWDIEICPIVTTGDRILDRALIELGGKGLFVKEIEEALLDGKIDFAVHSFKDMPAVLPAGLTIGATMKRNDPRDVLIAPGFRHWHDLPEKAIIGTSSLRRQAQIKALRPDLVVRSLRGNVDTRLKKIDAGDAHATILALAGLDRLGIAERADYIFPTTEMLPAVAQGALCIECRADDAPTLSLLEKLNHSKTHHSVTAERALLRILEGSCRTPIAAYATVEDKQVFLKALIAKPDGSQSHYKEAAAPLAEAHALGEQVGHHLRNAAGPHFLDG